MARKMEAGARMVRPHLITAVLTSLLAACGTSSLDTGGAPDDASSTEGALTYGIQLSRTSLTVAPGRFSAFTATVTASGASTRRWALSAADLPAGVTAVFNPASVVTGEVSNVTLSATSAALVDGLASSTSTIRVVATSGFYSHDGAAQLTIDRSATGGIVLENGVAVTRYGAQGSAWHFVIDVPAGATDLEVSIASGTGDADLYLRFGSPPTTASWDCRPYLNGNAEKCTVAAPKAGSYFVMLEGYAAYSGVSLLAKFVSSGSGGGGGGSGVGPTGGTVNLLHFGVSGDTRPPSCDDTANYPTAVIDAIASAIKAKGSQFAVDLGDHMFVCNYTLATARAQMALFKGSMDRFGGTWFMTMGNHECWHNPCLLGSTNANYVAYMETLAPVSSKPYYAVNVQTSLGRATFVTIADNGWDDAQAAWLEQTLAEADLHAKYTIVMRHHPPSDTSVAGNALSMQIIRAHKFALLLTGHSHLYKHLTTTDEGRDVVLGIGGAPLAGSSFNGYAMIDQLADGRLQFTAYDLAGNLPADTWIVGPNP
jgi:hypothetical protein